MFSKKSKVVKNNVTEITDLVRKSIPSIIVSDLNIKGDLTSEGAIEIGGSVNGNIRCNYVTIRKGAKINGNIEAGTLIIHGYVEGKAKARNISVASAGHVKGKIEYGYLNIESGATIECECKKVVFPEDQNMLGQEKSTDDNVKEAEFVLSLIHI